jgi:hypothetical protein
LHRKWEIITSFALGEITKFCTGQFTRQPVLLWLGWAHALVVLPTKVPRHALVLSTALAFTRDTCHDSSETRTLKALSLLEMPTSRSQL